MALVGCGRLDFDVRGDVNGDGSIATGDAVDGAAMTACKQWGSFAPPTRIAEVGSAGTDDWGPFVTPDGLTMYLFSSRTGSTSGSLDIWTATRTDPAGTFSTPTLVPNVNSIATERSPWLSRDGLTLGFASARAGGMGSDDIYVATRADTGQPFGAPVPLAGVNTASDEFFAIPSTDGLRLYMVSNRLGTLDIFVTERATLADTFPAPNPIAELNSAQSERHLAISSDELEVFIDSDRTGSQGVDIWRATRPNRGTAFSTPQLVPELNSAMDEVAPMLSADGAKLYYAYNTLTAGGADAEVWVATRPCLVMR